jgi:hypothetical protein
MASETTRNLIIVRSFGWEFSGKIDSVMGWEVCRDLACGQNSYLGQFHNSGKTILGKLCYFIVGSAERDMVIAISLGSAKEVGNTINHLLCGVSRFSYQVGLVRYWMGLQF